MIHNIFDSKYDIPYEHVSFKLKVTPISSVLSANGEIVIHVDERRLPLSTNLLYYIKINTVLQLKLAI